MTQSSHPGSVDKIRLLGAVELFASLTPEELQTVAKHSRWLSAAQGQLLFTGDDGGHLYAVKEGEVLITRPGDQGRDISLATFVAGDSFGELGLFDPQPGGSSARAECDSVLLVFPAGPGDDAVGAARSADEAPAMASADPGAGRGGAPDRHLAERFFERHPTIAAKLLHGLLGVVARRIRSTNRLIAEKSPWVQELRRQVMIDKLTGLYNAGFLDEDLARMVEAQGTGVCLLMLKPDNFKTVNDSYGHEGGDRVLQLMAKALRGRLGDHGVAVRYGGDVLAAVLPDGDMPAARRMAQAVRLAMKAIALDEITGGAPLQITVSLGIACCGSAGTCTAASLIERAYENLFTARNRGGDRLCASGRKRAGND